MTKTKLLSIAACVCGCLCLLIWFVPGSYSHLYLETTGSEMWVTSLFSFFPALVLLPLLCALIPLWAVYAGKTTRIMAWTFLFAATLQCLYLGFIGAICLPYSYGETFIWLKALPFPLTIAGAVCFLFSFRTQTANT